MATKTKRKKGLFGLDDAIAAALVSGIITAVSSAASATASTVQKNKEARKQSRLADEQAAAQQRTEDTSALDQSLNAEVENEEQEGQEENVNDAIDNQETETTNQSGTEEEQERNGRFKRGGRVSMSRTKHNKIFSCGGRRRADYGTDDDENKKSGRGAGIAAGILGGLAQAGQTAMSFYGLKQQNDILSKLGNNNTTIENKNINNNTNTSSNIVTATSNASSNSIIPDYAGEFADRNSFKPYFSTTYRRFGGRSKAKFGDRIRTNIAENKEARANGTTGSSREKWNAYSWETEDNEYHNKDYGMQNLRNRKLNRLNRKINDMETSGKDFSYDRQGRRQYSSRYTRLNRKANATRALINS